MLPIYHLNTWQSHLSGTFSITRLEARPGPTAIHRHEHFELIYLTRGRLDCKIDMEEYSLSASNVCFIRPGKLHHLPRQHDAEGFLLCLAPKFCRLSAETILALNTGQPHLQVPDGNQAAMTELLEWMKSEQDQGGLYKNEKKYHTHRRPADYAEELFLSTSYLNQTFKTVSGRTTSFHIHQRVVLEAQRMAVYDNSSLKEAARQCFKEFKRRSPLIAVSSDPH